MTTHEFDLEMPHSAARIWALFQDYDRWTDYAPMVHRVDILWPGDDEHNGRLRRVFYKLPDDQTGTALELSPTWCPRWATPTRCSRTTGTTRRVTSGSTRLGPNRTMLHFDETANIDPEIYEFINKHNEDSMRAASQYLTDHPEYRPDLIEA